MGFDSRTSRKLRYLTITGFLFALTLAVISPAFAGETPGTIIIVKDAVPDDPQDFSFTDDIAEPGSFMLDDDDADSVLSDTRTFTGVIAGDYEVSETVPAGWFLDGSSDCDDGNSSFDGETAFISLEEGETVTCTFVNKPVSDVGFSKFFFPDTIGPGSTTTLTFVIDNLESMELITDLAFIDVLPAGITLADPASASTDCIDGVVTTDDDPDSISLSGGTLGVFESCTVTVNVVGTATATNTSGDLTSSEGNSGAAVATLTVDTTRVGLSKSFSPASIPLGGTSTLTFELTNDDGASQFNISFTDPLPAGMVVATPANVSTDCVAAVTAVSGTPLISAAGGLLPAGSSCTIEVDVTTDSNGLFVNTTLLAQSGPFGSPVPGGFATAELDVPIEFLVKSFTDDPVPPGGTVTLEFNLLNTSRDFPATAIAFDDPLPAGLLFSSLVSDDCGGSLDTGTPSLLSYSGGSLPAEGTCTIRVLLTVPPATVAGDYTNTTTAITATIDGEGFTGNTAEDVLTVDTAPVLTKLFVGDPVGAGGDVTLSFTVTNTSMTSGATGITFLDELTAGTTATGPTNGFLPSPVTVSGPTPSPPCGAGSSFSLVPIVDDRQGLELAGGILTAVPGAGSSCTFEVTLTIPEGFPGGTYLNTTEPISATVGGMPLEGLPASDDVVVLGAPELAKEFTDDPVDPGAPVTLQFTLSHPIPAPGLEEPPVPDITMIAFTDDLDDALGGLLATGLPIPACGGTASTPDGGMTIEFSGGTLTAGEICTFSVVLSVPGSAAPGGHTNTTSAVTATVLGEPVTGLTASDDLEIATLKLTKEFDPQTVIAGDTTTLRFTLDNQSEGTVTGSGTVFIDSLGAILPGTPDVTVVSALPISVCGGTLSSPFDTFLVFSDGSISANSSCSFEVTVLVPAGAADGTYPNITSGTTTSAGLGDPAVAELTVDSLLIDLVKEFDNPAEPGGTTTLRFTLTNLSSEESLTDIAFSDDLDAALSGLLATGLPVSGCGGMLTTSDGGMTVDFAGGTLDPSETCFFDVTVSVPVLPVGTVALNTTSGVTGMTDPDDLDVTGDPATDELRIGFLDFAKAFDGPVKAGESVDLTFTITNLDTAPATALGFSDNLDAVISGLIATGLPAAACGGTLITPDGGSTVLLVGGSLAAAGSPGDSCLFTVSVDVPGGASLGTFTNTTSDLSASGLEVGDPAVADLEIEPPVDFSKIFLPDTIGPGSTTTLEFTITNDSGSLAEDVAFTDTLPAGVLIATPSSAFTDCSNGVLSAADGGTTIGLTGARVGIGVTCTVTVNVTAAAVGTYDNVSGELTSTAGSGGMAAATLTVDAGRPGFSKSFAPEIIPPGGLSTLTFTVDNSASPDDVFQLNFTDTMPAGLVVATPSNASTDCTGTTFPATLSADSGTGVITLAAVGFEFFEDPVLAAGATCTVTVDVTAASDDLYENVSGELTSEPGFVKSSGFATDLLDVRQGFLVKSFTDDPVPPGGMVTLEFTVNNPSRTEPATDIEFSDDLDAALPGLFATGLPISACGGTLSTTDGGMTIDFSGGSLPAEGQCTITVTLQLPAMTTGFFSNTTSSITATIDGMTETGDPASDILAIVAAPVLTKEFLDATTMASDPVVAAGDDVLIRFTITNVSTTSGATDIAFTDELTTFLPYPVAAVLPADGFCGVGSSMALTEPFTETHVLSVTGGSLDPAPGAGATCSFDVTVTIPTGVATNTYLNTTGNITATVDATAVSGPPASDTLDVVAAPRLTKEFLDDPVQPGDMVTLEFTLEHDALAPGDAVDVEFTDDLAMVVTDLAGTGLPLMDLCGPGNGMMVGTAMDTLLTFSGATLTPGQICTFSVTLSVPATAEAGSHTNTTSNVVATVLGLDTTENPAEDDLMIGGLLLTKEFTDDPVIAGNPVTLEFVISNQSPDPVADIFFEDLLDPDVLAGLTVVLPLPIEPCGPGSLLEIFSAPEVIFPPTPAIDEALRLSGGSLDPTGPMEGDGTCSFSVTLDVPGTTPSGTYPNRTRDFEATVGGTTQPFPDAQDDLVVANEQLLLTKEFIDDPVVPGGTVTLEFGISTLGASDSASDLAFTDDLDAALTGLVATGLPISACGGTLSTPDGGMTLEFSGGSFTAGDCGISVTLDIPMAVPFGTTITNTTSELTGTIEGSAVTGEPASDDLIIDFFTFTKLFDGLTKPTGTPVLTFMITNLSTMDTVTDLGFTDDLGAVIPGLVATSLPVEPCGVGSSISGTSVLAMSSGTLLPGGTCTFSVDLLVPPDSGGGSFLNTTSDLEILGVPVAAPATAFLDVDPPPVFGKAFIPDFILPGFRSALTFLIDNADSLFPVTDLAFTDTLPAGLTVAFSADIGTTCSGGIITAPEGGGSITFSGGSLPAGGFCFVQVDVTGTVPGTYPNTSSPLTSSSGESAAAIDTLVIVESGGTCAAPDGENLTIDNDTFMEEAEFVVCDTITVSPALGVGVLGPDGNLILRAGVLVEFGNGFVVGPDGKLRVSIEPVLIP